MEFPLHKKLQGEWIGKTRQIVRERRQQKAKSA